MPQSLANNLIHLVFSTKHREPWLTDAFRVDFHAYLAAVMNNLQCPVLALNFVDDHVHLLFSLYRTVTLATVVEDAKTSSSRWLKTQAAHFAPFAWQGGYGAFSVSQSNVAQVTRYIIGQAEHHQKMSFQDEIRALLMKNSLNFDERFLWD